MRSGDAPKNAATARAGSTIERKPAADATDDDIRPMRMAPIPLRAHPTGVSAATVGMLGGSGGESGGDDPPDDLAPLVTGSGGGSGGTGWAVSEEVQNPPVPDKAKYKIVTGVPVGTVMSLTVTSPDPSYVINTVTWSNGSDVSDYFSADPEAPPPTAVSVQKK